jgi:tRNA (uracil-5-)-methyltransferase TRM9
MHPTTQSFLLDLNRQFYQTFGRAFAATRRRIQPGVRQVLGQLAAGGRWVDLGCGSGALANVWAETGRKGLYLGLDFSAALLEEARQGLKPVPQGLDVHFERADLSDPGWSRGLRDASFDGALAFAVLHHLPGVDLRQRVLEDVRRLLKPGGLFVHSEWQFQHSPKLMARRQPWETIGLTDADVEVGDTLLDWRYALPGQPEQVGMRYVHLFDREELARLAGETGFEVIDEFESDGEGGRLGLYQVWRRLPG